MKWEKEQKYLLFGRKIVWKTKVLYVDWCLWPERFTGFKKGMVINMRRIFRYIVGSSVALLFALITVITPRIFFRIQDEEIIGDEKKKSVVLEDKNSYNQVEYGVEEKIDMLSDDSNLEYVLLDTGSTFSLYEARLQCFRELCKIPSLEMDVYGPVKEEIDVKPYLLIPVKVPSRTFILWKGKLVIDKVTYTIVLDEESGKIIKLESNSFDNVESNNKIIEEWKKYLKKDE